MEPLLTFNLTINTDSHWFTRPRDKLFFHLPPLFFLFLDLFVSRPCLGSVTVWTPTSLFPVFSLLRVTTLVPLKDQTVVSLTQYSTSWGRGCSQTDLRLVFNCIQLCRDAAWTAFIIQEVCSGPRPAGSSGPALSSPPRQEVVSRFTQTHRADSEARTKTPQNQQRTTCDRIVL